MGSIPVAGAKNWETAFAVSQFFVSASESNPLNP